MGNKSKKRDDQDSDGSYFHFLLICILVLLAIMAVIAALVVNSLAPFTVSYITADGALGYIGSIIVGLASVLVAIVAVWQSREANEITARTQDLEKDRYKLDLRPFVLISNVSYEKKKYNDILKLTEVSIYTLTGSLGQKQDSEWREKEDYQISGILWIRFINSTNSLLTIRFKGANDKTGKNWNYSLVNNVVQKTTIPPNCERDVGFAIEENIWNRFVDRKEIIFSFVLENRFSRQYQEEITLWVSRNSFAKTFNNNIPIKNDILYFTNKYRIGKILKSFNSNIMPGQTEDQIEWEEL